MGSGPEHSEASEKVARCKARIPARFVEKWGDVQLARMTKQLVRWGRDSEWETGAD